MTHIFQRESDKLQLLIEKEKKWKSKYSELKKDYINLKSVLLLHEENLKKVVNAKPILITRSVGINCNIEVNW